jgi:23S rRNA pseudouridine2605 synthase
MAEIRLQKLLADRGVASRRSAAALIRAGRVTVSGTRIIEPGHRIDSMSAEIAVDGNPLPPHSGKKRTIMLNKPRGYICSTRAQSETSHTVFELLHGIDERLVVGGRLDKDSEGLVLLSNDGELIQRVTHPRFNHAKTYEAVVVGRVDSTVLKLLQSRLVIDGYRIQKSRVRIIRQRGKHTELEIVLREGRNRQIRKMCSIAGLRVHQLRRSAIGDIEIGKLCPGDHRDLTESELISLDSRAPHSGTR